jgi:hypothetical protein
MSHALSALPRGLEFFGIEAEYTAQESAAAATSHSLYPACKSVFNFKLELIVSAEWLQWVCPQPASSHQGLRR